MIELSEDSAEHRRRHRSDAGSANGLPHSGETAAGPRCRTEPGEHRWGTALTFAGADGYEAVVRMLLNRGAEVNRASTEGGTALTYSAVNGYYAVVQQLLDCGAEVNHAVADGSTALFLPRSTAMKRRRGCCWIAERT